MVEGKSKPGPYTTEHGKKLSFKIQILFSQISEPQNPSFLIHLGPIPIVLATWQFCPASSDISRGGWQLFNSYYMFSKIWRVSDKKNIKKDLFCTVWSLFYYSFYSFLFAKSMGPSTTFNRPPLSSDRRIVTKNGCRPGTLFAEIRVWPSLLSIWKERFGRFDTDGIRWLMSFESVYFSMQDKYMLMEIVRVYQYAYRNKSIQE